MANDIIPAPTGQLTDLTQSMKEKLFLRGDLSLLTPDERLSYMGMICQRIGVDPLTRPFELITLDGKLTWYARKDCTEQLRSKRGISVELLSVEEDDANRVVRARVKATLPDGRTDMDEGCAPLTYDQSKTQQYEVRKNPESGKDEKIKVYPLMVGTDRANARKKAITQAKRRVTLSICGLGFLDESEVEAISPERIRPSEPIKPDQIEKLQGLYQSLNLTSSGVQTHLGRYDVDSTAKLSDRQADELIAFLEKVRDVNISNS